MNKTHIIGQILSMAGYFSNKKYVNFFIVLYAIQSLNAGPEMFLSYIVQIFLLYKMMKRKFKKKGILGVKRGLQCEPLRVHF